MRYPDFFDTIETIPVIDPLSEVLGAFEGGEYEFSYLDVVKLAGHSCPSVAGAYLLCKEALKRLYPNQRAQRGSIKVEFQEALHEGVVGVMANIVSQVTGATQTSGFKGFQGKFARHSLMDFNVALEASVRFTRLDNAQSVEMNYDPSNIPAQPRMMQLMQNIASGSVQEQAEFRKLWQERVYKILQSPEQVIKLRE